MKKTNEKGITLIALIVTIIVLLILASVSIAMLTGENGILTQANDAKVITEFSSVKEAVSLKKNEIETYERIGEEEEIAKVGTAYTNENPYGPINIWGYDTVFGEGWYKLNKEDLKELGIDNTQNEYIVNYDNGYVISTEKFKFNGKETYTIDEVKIKKLVFSQLSLYILRSDGTLWAVGANQYGQLGLGDTENRNIFQQVKITNIKEIYSNIYNIFAKTENEQMYAWGLNIEGELGVNDRENKLIPTKLEIDNVKKVFPYWYHTILMKNDGTIWATGRNTYGELGLGDNKSRIEFTKININPDEILDVKLGMNHTILLKKDGTVWTTGEGERGQLGLGNSENKNVFTNTGLSNVKQIVNANVETIVLKNDGTIWGTGLNQRGELGIGNVNQQNTFQKALLENVSEINGNYSTFIAKTNDDKLYGWGLNVDYQFALDNNDNILVPQELFYEDVKEIYAGCYIIKNDNTLWGCGLNRYGQLAQGNFQENYKEFVRINFIK